MAQESSSVGGQNFSCGFTSMTWQSQPGYSKVEFRQLASGSRIARWDS